MEENVQDNSELLGMTSASENINIDFVFCDAKEDDEPWIRALISKGWTGRLFNQDEMKLRDLAQKCSEQVEIGTFVKTEQDDESVYAFATVFQANEHLPQSVQAKLNKMLSGQDSKKKRIGWIVREAIVNVPSQVTYQLLHCLKDDIEWAEKQKFAKYDSFVILCPCYNDEAKPDSSSYGSSVAKKKAKRTSNYDYALSEDMVLANVAVDSAFFQIPRPRPVEGVDLPESLEHAPWGCHALLIERESLFQAIETLQNV